MGKRRHTKNKKRKMIGGEGGNENSPAWKRARDLYDPIHQTMSEPEPEEIPKPEVSPAFKNVSVKGVTVPYKRSPKSRNPSDPRTLRGTMWPSQNPDKMTSSNTPEKNSGDAVDTNPDHIVIKGEPESVNDQSNILDKPINQWTIKGLYGIRGGARRKSKSSKKKRKQKRKTQKRKSSKRKSYKRI
jgi:hypothetical protein